MWATGGEGQDCDSRAMASAWARASSARPGAHFDEQKADAGRKVIETFKREALAAHEIDEHGIEAFEADGTVFKDRRHGVGGEKRHR